MADGILLVGCGRMGGALLSGWLERGMNPDEVTVIEPAGADAVPSGGRVSVLAAADALAEGFAPDTVVFAVKPQVMEEAAPPYRRFAGPDTVFLSIAAGRTIASFERLLGREAAIVRSMPNTPAAVGRGITVACANPHVADAQRGRCQALLEAVGEVAWVEEETLLDAVTAVSGSGPAYVFLMIECLAEAGRAAGLAPDLSARLARATVIGSGELARLSAADAAELRRNVTSPGGTTEAALAVLMQDDSLCRLLSGAVRAAAERSRALAG